MEIEGYEDKLIKHQRSPLLPSWTQVLLYLGLGFLLLVITSRTSIIGWLGGDSLQTLGGIDYIVQGENYYLDNIFAIPILGTVAVVLFWATIGCSLYCLVWGMTNTVKEAKKYDEAANASVLPTGYSKHKFWETTLANIILMVSSLCLFLFLFVFTVSYVLPASEQLLITVLSNVLSLNALLSTLIFVVTTIFIGHGMYFSLHAFNYARKTIFF